MQPYESPQRGTANNEKYRNFYSNRDAEIWGSPSPGNRTYFTSDFDVSFTTTTGRSPRPATASRQGPSKRKKRLFVSWTVRLNDDNHLVVEGLLECGRRARSKPIKERLSASEILSKFKHEYHLVGNMADPQCELPGFVRHRFQAGFPQDWETVVEIWKSFVTSGPNGGMRSPFTPGSFIIEKKLKLAVDDGAESPCFVECAQKVDRVDSVMYNHEDRIDDCENIENLRYWENSEQSKAKMNRSMEKSVVNYGSQSDPGSKTIKCVRRLAGWTPFVVLDETVKYSLVFRGTLLSSTGHAVGKNHLTDPVRRRLSARIIETANRELYELIGDIKNTKREVPKELVTWCRYGCPKQIESFCEKWRMLRGDEMPFRRPLSQGEMNSSQDRGGSSINCDDKSARFVESVRTSSPPRVQATREENKRKRMELNDECHIIVTRADNDTTYNKKPDAILFDDSRNRRWPKIRRKDEPKLPETSREGTGIAKGDDSKITERVRPSVADEKQPPSLSYVYHECAPLADCILSDGV